MAKLDHAALSIRKVRIDDIGEVYKLLTANRPYVGLNSRYTYFLLARDFNGTCLVALDGQRIVAFSSGYVPPTRPDTFFINLQLPDTAFLYAFVITVSRIFESSFVCAPGAESNHCLLCLS